MKPAGSVFVLLLAGCVATPSTTPKETPLAPQALGLNDAPAPLIADQWWTAFGDPELNALEQEGLQKSPTLANAMARVRDAEAQLAESRAARYPQVTFDAEEQRERFSKDYIIPPPFGGSTRFIGTVGANLSWSLDLFGKQAAQIARARATADAARLDADAARILLAGTIAQTYIQFARDEVLETVSREALTERSEVLALTRGRVNAGLETKAAEKQAEALYELAREDATAAGAAKETDIHLLAQLTGRGADAYAMPTPHLDPRALALPGILPADLLARRADIAAAEARVKAAMKGRLAAQRAFYPDINLLAMAGWAAIGLAPMFSASAFQAAAGPALHLPVFDAGTLRARYAGATAELDSAIADYNESVVGAVRGAADAITDLKKLEQQSGEQTLALSAAEESFRLARERYRSGLNPQQTMLDAEATVISARRQLASLTYQLLDARVALVMALGGGFGGAESMAEKEKRP